MLVDWLARWEENKYLYSNYYIPGTVLRYSLQISSHLINISLCIEAIHKKKFRKRCLAYLFVLFFMFRPRVASSLGKGFLSPSVILLVTKAYNIKGGTLVVGFMGIYIVQLLQGISQILQRLKFIILLRAK